MDYLIYIPAFLVTILILVTVHEFGHYWVARRCGVRVLRFSVGFGNPFWKKVDKHGTEWAIAPFPLGGYVKMYGENLQDVPTANQHESFAHKSVGQRMAIVFAGPAINLLLAVLVFWVQAMVGVPDRSNQLVYVGDGSLGDQAGLNVGDRIVAVDGEPVNVWSKVGSELSMAATEQRDVTLTAENSAGERREAIIELSCLPSYAKPADMFKTIGLVSGVPPAAIPLQVIEVVDEPARKAGLAAGDTILAVNNQSLQNQQDWDQAVTGLAGQTVQLQVQRDTRTLDVPVTLGIHPNYADRALLGVRFDIPRYAVYHGPLEAIPVAFTASLDMFDKIATSIWKMLTGNVSYRYIGGPVQIAEVAGDTAKLGFGHYLGLLAALSIMLGIMNLLPVPVLDGGHLLYYAAEWVRGKPLSERAQALGLRIGLGLIVALMAFAFINDFVRVGERLDTGDAKPLNLCAMTAETTLDTSSAE